MSRADSRYVDGRPMRPEESLPRWSMVPEVRAALAPLLAPGELDALTGATPDAHEWLVGMGRLLRSPLFRAPHWAALRALCASFDNPEALDYARLRCQSLSGQLGEVVVRLESDEGAEPGFGWDVLSLCDELHSVLEALQQLLRTVPEAAPDAWLESLDAFAVWLEEELARIEDELGPWLDATADDLRAHPESPVRSRIERVWDGSFDRPWHAALVAGLAPPPARPAIVRPDPRPPFAVAVAKSTEMAVSRDPQAGESGVVPAVRLVELLLGPRGLYPKLALRADVAEAVSRGEDLSVLVRLELDQGLSIEASLVLESGEVESDEGAPREVRGFGPLAVAPLPFAGTFVTARVELQRGGVPEGSPDETRVAIRT